MKIERILAGIDFGPKTENIIAYTSYFANKMNASIQLLYVIDYLVTPPAYLTPYIEEEKKIAEKSFDALKERLHDEGIKTYTEVIIGRLQESFDTAIKKLSPDMLVLGFMTHTFRRSSSEKLIKGLQMPMLVVRGKKSETSGAEKISIRKILCPVDFSEISKKALKVAKELGDILSSRMDIIHVSQDYIIKKIKTKEEKDRARKELQVKSRKMLDTFLQDSGVEGKGIIDEGEPSKKIVSISEEKEIDLIVMGARGLGLIKGMLIGSVTDAVLKSSHCPVLVIH